jgi:hypothetical protein
MVGWIMLGLVGAVVGWKVWADNSPTRSGARPFKVGDVVTVDPQIIQQMGGSSERIVLKIVGIEGDTAFVEDATGDNDDIPLSWLRHEPGGKVGS